jgi:methylenetetrahydrofolate--tRNA-(uracil-5-)-methyltransferase
MQISSERGADGLRATVIGGGLAGCEAAWQLVRRGVRVDLFEMRPVRMTPAHRTSLLAELVCSNSLGSNLRDRPLGLLKEELRVLGSLVMDCADHSAVPAGGALAVGREAFAQRVTTAIQGSPLITIHRQEISAVPDTGIVVVATGPLTSDALAEDITRLAGRDQLYFFDAMAPIVTASSINLERAFRAARYGRGNDDYINCPLTSEEYAAFVDQLLAAETIELRSFEREDARFFDACLPIEEMARRGRDSLAFGPLRPVGLIDPRSGQRPDAVVQLRQDDVAGTLYNMVGFQTNLRWGEQERVFSLIPGLERAEFVRYGQMHRNTFLRSPGLLSQGMEWLGRPGLFFAGQITGTEGYVASVASGCVAGINAGRACHGEPLLVFPDDTMVGAMCRYVAQADASRFQPMKPNLGLLPALDTPRRRKRDRDRLRTDRALASLHAFVAVTAL